MSDLPKYEAQPEDVGDNEKDQAVVEGVESAMKNWTRDECLKILQMEDDGSDLETLREMAASRMTTRELGRDQDGEFGPAFPDEE